MRWRSFEIIITKGNVLYTSDEGYRLDYIDH